MDGNSRAAVLADAAQRFSHEDIKTIMAILDEYPRYKGGGGDSETDTEAGIARVHLRFSNSATVTSHGYVKVWS